MSSSDSVFNRRLPPADHKDPHPEFKGTPQEALSQAESAATQELKQDHDAAIKRRLSRAQLELKEIVNTAERNGGDAAALLKWERDYLDFIKRTSMSRQVFDWIYETTNGIHKSVHEGRETMTQHTSITNSTLCIKPAFVPHVEVVRAILKTGGEVWYQELSTFLHDLQECIAQRILDRRAPYDLGFRGDYKSFRECFKQVKNALLPSEHRKEEVSRTEWFKRFHAMKVLKGLVKMNQPVLDKSGLTPLFDPQSVLARMHAWNPPPHLVAPLDKQDSLRKFSPIGRKEVANRF